MINGGLLEEVHWVLHTEDQNDIAWLLDLIKTHEMDDYYKVFHDEQVLQHGKGTVHSLLLPGFC